jgi:carboxymethylenebutenolidase
MDQRIIDLYDDFTHSRIERRQFMERLASVAGSAAAGAALLPLLRADKAAAAVVPADDQRVTGGYVSYPGPKGPIKAYRAAPRDASGSLGSVLVIHENRGLNGYVEDVARRVALAGYVGLAPDLLSPMGGTPGDEDQARDMIGKLDAADTVANIAAGVTWLAKAEGSNGKVDVLGFCWGGGMANLIAADHPLGLAGAVAFYGRVPPADKVTGIEVPLLLHYAGLDKGTNAGIPDYEAALKQHGAKYQVYIYEGANHAFHNDTSAARYDKAAAELAWDRSVAFFGETLKG